MREPNTPNDPGRRERIVGSTMELLYAGGVAAVTARAVAAHAKVQVASVSYYFESVDALLLEASRRVARQRIDELLAWRDTVTPETLMERLAELTYSHLADGRRFTVLAYELYVLGLRVEAFREVGRSVIEALRSALATVVPDETAQHLAATADGIQLAALVEPEPPTVERLLRMFVADSRSSMADA